MRELFEFFEGEASEAVRLLRNFGRTIFWFALLMFGASVLGIRLHLTGQLNPLLAVVHPTPNWAELLFGAAVVALFFLIMGLVMLMVAGQLVADRQRLFSSAE